MNKFSNNNSGVYQIINLLTGKTYIGSTKNFGRRKELHFGMLNAGKHSNSNLQEAYNEFGKDCFEFQILELSSIEDLLINEQTYIDKYDKEELYNIHTVARNLGGSVYLSIPTVILDLKGNVFKRCDSISEASYLIKTEISRKTINTSAISRRMYRVVTKEFYEDNLETILTWESKTGKEKALEIVNNRRKKSILLYNGQEYKDNQHLADNLGVTKERIRQILITGKSKKYKICYKHPELK